MNRQSILALVVAAIMLAALATGAREAKAAIDFGDAPEPYPTKDANDGARHIIDANVYLGWQIDAEPDGQPNTKYADGDDANGIDDEDGVLFMSNVEPGWAADVNVVASCNGLLDAWLDFNIDGDWSDPGEQIFTSYPLNSGDNILTFNVPTGAVWGHTYARFRFSTAGGLDPNGLADDGEVEDYKVFIGDCPCWGNISEPVTLTLHEEIVDTGDMAALLTLLILYGDPLNNHEVSSIFYDDYVCIDIADTLSFGPPDNKIDAGDMAALLTHLILNGDPADNWAADCYPLQ